MASKSLAESSTHPTSDGAAEGHGVRAALSFVTLNSPKRFLNTLSILPTAANTGAVTAAAGHSSASSARYPPTVILPGYGAGIGFFYLNIPALGTWAAHHNSPVYAVDWLGMGRSARVPFRINAKREDIQGRVDQAERFFTDALEEWRIKQGIDRMALIGHSLGGYLSVAYALRYPTRVSKLILLSPAGVPRDPNGIVSARHMRSPGEAQSEPSAVKAHALDAKELNERREALRIARRNESLFRRFATWAWEEGWSPFQIVRSIVFWGPLIVGKVHGPSIKRHVCD
jgi:cardiolipin-specific phospholipase